MNFDNTILSFKGDSSTSYYSQSSIILNDVSSNVILNTSSLSFTNMNSSFKISLVDNIQININGSSGNNGSVLMSGGDNSIYWGTSSNGSNSGLQDVINQGYTLDSIGPLTNQVISYDGTKVLWATPNQNVSFTNLDVSFTNLDVSGQVNMSNVFIDKSLNFNLETNIIIDTSYGSPGQILTSGGSDGFIYWSNKIETLQDMLDISNVTTDSIIIKNNNNTTTLSDIISLQYNNVSLSIDASSVKISENITTQTTTDVNTININGTINTPTIKTLVYSLDGKMITIGDSLNNIVKIFYGTNFSEYIEITPLSLGLTDIIGFGHAIALSSNGSVIAFGVPDAHHVFICNSTDNYATCVTINVQNGNFGNGVALSADGLILFVSTGHTSAGWTNTIVFGTPNWTQIRESDLYGPNDGQYLDIKCSYDGSLYAVVYSGNGTFGSDDYTTMWIYYGTTYISFYKYVISNAYNTPVKMAMSFTGDVIAVATQNNVYVYKGDINGYSLTNTYNGTNFGLSISLSYDGNRLAIGSLNDVIIYYGTNYEYNITSSGNDSYGSFVALDPSGENIIIAHSSSIDYGVVGYLTPTITYTTNVNSILYGKNIQIIDVSNNECNINVSGIHYNPYGLPTLEYTNTMININGNIDISEQSFLTYINTSGTPTMKWSKIYGQDASFNNVSLNDLNVSTITINNNKGNVGDILTSGSNSVLWATPPILPIFGQIIPSNLSGQVNLTDYNFSSAPIIILTADSGTTDYMIPVSLAGVTTTYFNWVLASSGVSKINYIIYSG